MICANSKSKMKKNFDIIVENLKVGPACHFENELCETKKIFTPGNACNFLLILTFDDFMDNYLKDR